MSGGAFSYQQYQLTYLADEIKELILSNDDESLDEYGQKRGMGYEHQTINVFKEAEKLLRHCQILVHRIDWLVSGDDGEDTFHERLAEDLGGEDATN